MFNHEKFDLELTCVTVVWTEPKRTAEPDTRTLDMWQECENEMTCAGTCTDCK